MISTTPSFLVLFTSLVASVLATTTPTTKTPTTSQGLCAKATSACEGGPNSREEYRAEAYCAHLFAPAFTLIYATTTVSDVYTFTYVTTTGTVQQCPTHGPQKKRNEDAMLAARAPAVTTVVNDDGYPPKCFQPYTSPSALATSACSCLGFTDHANETISSTFTLTSTAPGATTHTTTYLYTVTSVAAPSCSVVGTAPHTAATTTYSSAYGYCGSNRYSEHFVPFFNLSSTLPACQAINQCADTAAQHKATWFAMSWGDVTDGSPHPELGWLCQIFKGQYSLSRFELDDSLDYENWGYVAAK